MAVNATKKSGARNDMVGSADAHQPLAIAQIAEQRFVERFGRVEQDVIDARIGALRSERLDVIPNHLAVLLCKDVRDDRHLLAALEVLESRRIPVGELNLGGIQHVKDDEI